jgi:hypothetical protein
VGRVAVVDMKGLHHLRNEESGAVCVFHPELPVVACAAITGEMNPTGTGS